MSGPGRERIASRARTRSRRPSTLASPAAPRADGGCAHGPTIPRAPGRPALLAVAAAPVAARNENAVNAFDVTVLQSDASDASLVNGWGIVSGPTTPWWVSNEGTDTSTLYNAAGAKQALTVGVAGGPTGVVFNGGTSFPVTAGGTNVARFIFADAQRHHPGRGLAARPPRSSGQRRPNGVLHRPDDRHGRHAPYLYAADFANGRVDVYDGAFALQDVGGAFIDPSAPRGYDPFGIQERAHDLRRLRVPGPPATSRSGDGLGVVSAFGTDGSFRAASRPAERSTRRGASRSPGELGRFAGHLLVGNFGDGRINAFPPDARRLGGPRPPQDREPPPLVIDGLWGISFGKGAPTTGRPRACSSPPDLRRRPAGRSG